MKVGLALLAVCVSACCAAQKIDPAAASLLKKMQAAYSGVKTAKFSQSFTRVGRNAQVDLKSQVIYSAPGRFRVKSTGVSGLGKTGYIVIGDGKQLYIEGLPGGSATQKYTERNMWQLLPETNLETLCFWDWKQQFSTMPGGNMFRSTFKVSKDQWKGKPYSILEEMAGNVRVRYFVDPKTSLIWRVETFNRNGKAPFTTATIEKMEINSPVDPASFVIPKKSGPIKV